MDKNKNLPPLPTLPMQLMLSMGTWLASPFAWASVKDASPLWKDAKNLPELQKALSEEVKNRANEMLSGVSRYLETPYRRNVKEPPAIWNQGAARLLDYGLGTVEAVKAKTIAFFIPSLINRYYILDLEENRSFMRYLASQNIYPLVLDWGTPGKKEENYSVDDYVQKVLLPAIDFVHQSASQKVALAGYCMGGILSLAAAQLAPKKISSLSLLATPWDFHCKQFAPFVVEKKWQDYIHSLIGANKYVPADVVQSLFYITDPWVFEHKFRRFFGMEPESRAAKDFVALEHWVNDGVPMTAKVAKDCMIGWAQQNLVAGGGWRVAEKIINPQKINLPTFIAIPKNDHVVPYECAWPLAQLMKNATLLHPSAGHVGMIVGQKAKKELWQPFVEWLRCIAPSSVDN